MKFGVLGLCVLDSLYKAEITSVGNGGRVCLTVRGDERQTLVTTIPAENGWAAYVDGERVETGKWLNAFLSLELPTGSHTVELRYTAPGLLPGAALGGTSAFIWIFTTILCKQKQKSCTQKINAH